jgi:predicted TPR repeat methyltransferase
MVPPDKTRLAPRSDIQVLVMSSIEDVRTPGEVIVNALHDGYLQRIAGTSAIQGNPIKSSQMLLKVAYASKSQLDVLEIGTSLGFSASALRDGGRNRLVGCEISEIGAIRAESTGLYDQIIVGDFVESGYRDLLAVAQKFDAVSMRDFVVYFGDIGQIFKKLFPLMRKGGVVIFDVNVHESSVGWGGGGEDEAPGRWRWELDNVGEWTHRMSYVEEHLAEMGFSVVSKYFMTKSQDDRFRQCLYIARRD